MIHRAHDYPALIKRWRSVARKVGGRLDVLCEADGFELVFMRIGTGNEIDAYISAGIHGDEAGSTEGFVTWAEQKLPSWRHASLILFPCLNPWGLTLNNRYNQGGADLNRCFDHPELPMVNAVRRVLADTRITACLALHEDYDAQGIYLYESPAAQPFWGEAIIEAASQSIPVDPRGRIDLGRSRGGIMRPRFDSRKHAALGGLPEAVYLQQNHTRRTITFETPSELGLDLRVKAQMACIQKTVELALMR